MQDFAVIIQENFRTGDNFFFREHAVAHEQVYILARLEQRHGFGGGAQVEQSAAFRFFHPFVGIVVAVEDYAAVFEEGILYYGGHFVHNIALGGVQPVCELVQRIRHYRVEHDVGTGYGEGGAEHTELELIARERKRGSAVAVCGILGEVREHFDAHFHFALGAFGVRSVFRYRA